MKKGLLALGVLFAATLLAVPRDAHAAHAEVSFARIGRSYAPPPLRSKQGWLTITNYDWKDYDITVSKKGKLYISPAGGGGARIRSGTQISIPLEKETWDLYGATSDKLKFKIREGRTTTLDLQPFGYVGNTGLRGISNDGDKVRNTVLFDNYAPPPVVVNRPPVIVATPPPPAPPPVIVRPPTVVHRPPPPVYHRPPKRHDRRDGWGFTFGYSSR